MAEQPITQAEIDAVYPEGRRDDGRRARLRRRGHQARSVADRGPRRRVDRLPRHGVPARARLQDQDPARQDRRERARRPARGRVRAEGHRHREGPGAARGVPVRGAGRALQDADEGRRHSAPVHAGDVLQARGARAARQRDAMPPASGRVVARRWSPLAGCAAMRRHAADHFAAFSFVDRIDALRARARARTRRSRCRPSLARVSRRASSPRPSGSSRRGCRWSTSTFAAGRSRRSPPRRASSATRARATTLELAVDDRRIATTRPSRTAARAHVDGERR